jgi:SAM-dependent methyltransferase
LDAERYDRTRPRYPQALVDRIVAESPGPDVVDVGIGTGLSAQPFQAAGSRVVGVEPDPRMAELARHRGFEVEVAKFEDWDPAGRTFDVLISGQAWHWVDPIVGAARAAEVLRPGGRSGSFWTSPLDAYSTGFTNTSDGIRQSAAFGEPEQWRFDSERSSTRDEWLDQVPTFGGHSQFPPGKLDELLAGIGSAIDAEGGSFTTEYAAVVVTATRIGDRHR